MQFRALASIIFTMILLGGCSKPSADQLMATANRYYDAAVASADSVRLSGDIKAHFQPSIDAYEKVADEYPGTPQAERALYLIATIRNNDTHEPDVAVKAYRHYLAAFPVSAQAPSALFLIGFIYNNEIHNTDSAAAAYREFLARFPQSEMASSAQYELDHLGQPADMSFPDTSAQGSASTAKKAPSRTSRSGNPS